MSTFFLSLVFAAAVDLRRLLLRGDRFPLPMMPRQLLAPQKHFVASRLDTHTHTHSRSQQTDSEPFDRDHTPAVTSQNRTALKQWLYQCQALNYAEFFCKTVQKCCFSINFLFTSH